MMRESRYHCGLNDVTISSTSPEYYDWRLDERSCRPSYLRISLIGTQRPHPSFVKRIPRMPFFYDTLAYFFLLCQRRTSHSRNSLAYAVCVPRFFSFLLRCTRMHLRQALLDVRRLSHQLIPDRRRGGLWSGMQSFMRDPDASWRRLATLWIDESR